MSVGSIGDSSLMSQLSSLGSSYQANNTQNQFQAMAYNQVKKIEENNAELMAKLKESNLPPDQAVGKTLNTSA